MSQSAGLELDTQSTISDEDGNAPLLSTINVSETSESMNVTDYTTRRSVRDVVSALEETTTDGEDGCTRSESVRGSVATRLIWGFLRNVPSARRDDLPPDYKVRQTIN